MNNKKYLLWICVVSTIVAIGAHIYLTNHYYNLKYGTPEAGSSLCSINETFNCDKTTMSSYSEFMGVPISIFGGLINFFLLALLIGSHFPILNKETQTKLKSSIQLFTLSLFLVSLAMGVLSYFVLHTICPACSIAYIMSLIGFISSWLYFGGGIKISAFEIKLFPTAGLSILVFAFFFHHNSLRQFGGKEIQELTRLQLDEWNNYPAKNITPVSPITLNASPQSKIKMIEFADFLCGHCAQAYPIIHSFVNSHPDVEFSFQAFPLDGECNTAIERSSGVPCYLARVAYCAFKQDKAWTTQKWIFSNQHLLLTKESILGKLKDKSIELELNYENLISCTESDEARNAITAQAKLGVEVGITGTPSVYINGKKVPAGFNLPLLEQIHRQVR